MGLFDLAGSADTLEDLFDRERTAILGGRFDLLEQLSHEKERLIADVARKPAGSEHLDRLRAKGNRNRDLLDAMSRGVRAATRRVEALAGKSAQLHTYDANGRRRSIAETGHSLQRRA